MHGGEAEGSRARWRAVAAAEEASIEAAAEETGVDDSGGDRRRAAM
jgi:hypothetical protein